MKNFCLVAVLLAVSGLKSTAQDQVSGWLASFNTIKLSSRSSLHAEVQVRSADEFSRIQTLLLRGGFNYRVREQVTLTAGYALIEGYRRIANASGYSPEHRLWQQLILNQKIKSVQMTHRGRLEQRFLGKSVADGSRLETNSYGYAGRIRYFNRSMLPLKKQGTFKKGMFIALQEEIFLNIGNKANVNGKTFDQNRAYGAAGYRFSSSFDLEAGYMHQWVNTTNSGYSNHIIQVAGYIRL